MDLHIIDEVGELYDGIAYTLAIELNDKSFLAALWVSDADVVVTLPDYILPELKMEHRRQEPQYTDLINRIKTLINR